MKNILSLLAILTISCGLLAQEEQPVPAPSNELSTDDRVRKALHLQLDALDEKEQRLTDLLALFAKITNENFILDPSLPRSVGDTVLQIKVPKQGTVLDALAVSLSLAGLRYTILDGAVFISTEGKLADKLLKGVNPHELDLADSARKPMSTGEASALKRPFDLYQDDFIQARDFISHYPHRLWEPETINPQTGLVDFPGPPIWQDSPDMGHPRFKYTTTPHFLKPEFIELERNRQLLREERQEVRAFENREDRRMLEAILRMLKENPDLSANELLKRFQAQQDK